MNSRLTVNVLLVLSALFSLWLVWGFVLDFNFEKPANPKTPDIFVHNMEVTVMNAQGEREYQLTSPFLLHYEENDRTNFTSPYLLMYEKDAPPWQAKALTGEAVHGNTHINLSGDVFLNQVKGHTNPPTNIKTTALTVYPKKRLITTDQYISAVQPNAKANGVGMQLDLSKETLQLFSKVEGIFSQPQKPPTQINADSATLNKASGIGVFQGRVKLTQETSTLLTPQLTVFVDNNNQLLKAIAEGEGTTYHSIADPKKPPFVATATTMQYFPPQNEIHLLGDAKAVQGPDSYSSLGIYYHIDQDRVMSDKGRTTIVLEPKTLKRGA